MEWTKSDKIHTAFPQSDKLGYHIYNLCGIQYPVYGGLVYHCECEDTKKNIAKGEPGDVFNGIL